MWEAQSDAPLAKRIKGIFTAERYCRLQRDASISHLSVWLGAWHTLCRHPAPTHVWPLKPAGTSAQRSNQQHLINSCWVKMLCRNFPLHLYLTLHCFYFRLLNFCSCPVSLGAGHSGVCWPYVTWRFLKDVARFPNWATFFFKQLKVIKLPRKTWKQRHTIDLAPKALTEISRGLH